MYLCVHVLARKSYELHLLQVFEGKIRLYVFVGTLEWDGPHVFNAKKEILNQSLANLTLFECCEIDWGHHFVFVDRPFFRK